MPTGPVNVLVVDDDRAIQRLVADALTQQGFSVTVERDGEWALKAFEMKDFDAVVLDLLLPLVNGYEVARKIRQMPKGKATPILMISGVYKNELHQREAVEHYGAFAFLEKPFKLSALQDALRSALGDKYPAPQAAPSIGEALEEATKTEQLAADEAKEEVKLVEARAPEPATTSIRGDFSQRPVPEVLAELHRWKASGALLIRRGTVKKIVYLREGVPQFVKSNLLSECLGRVMVRERLLSQGDCEESLRRMKASRRQQGTVLIEMGVISPNNLAHALNLQQRVKLFEVFGWSSGQYHFSPQKDLPPETINLDMTAAALIAEGVKRSYDHDRVRAALGAVDGLYVHPADDPLYALQNLGLGEEEQLLLQAVDGRKSLETLRALDLLSPLDTDRLIYAMRCAGVVELKPAPAEKDPSISFKEIAQSGPHLVAPPPLPARRPGDQGPTSSGAWSSLDGNVPAPPGAQGAAAAPDAAGQDTTSPTLYTADLLQNATVNSGPVSVPFVEISGSHSVSSAEDSLLRERLAGRVAAMRKQDHYEILGVPTTARPEDIHESYLVLARDFHPDKLASAASAEIRQLTEQIYNLVSLAHDTLMDPKERERYTADLAAGKVRREVGADVGRILAAEGKFQRGEDLLRKGSFAEAHAAFTEAVELYVEEGEFHAFKGWAHFQMDPQKNGDDALKELARAIQLNPKSDRTYLFAGYIHKAAGRPDLAEQHFEKAIQVNPSCSEAFKELSLLTWAARLGGGGKR